MSTEMVKLGDNISAIVEENTAAHCTRLGNE